MRKKERGALIGFLLILIVSIVAVTYLLTPENQAYGLKWDALLQEERDSLDVCLLGSSLVYSDIIPAVIYEETGLNSYLLATPEQTLGFSYYFLSELYKTQHPQLVCVEVSGVFFPKHTDFTKINIGFMPWSINRVKATLFAAEREEWLGLFFPLYNYHDLWTTPLHRNYRAAVDLAAGYVNLDGVRAVGPPKPRTVETEPEVYGRNLAYLREIAELCAQEGSEVLFFIAPSAWPWDDAYVQLIRDEVAGMGTHVSYLDFNEEYEALGLDSDVDYFDLLHLNNTGAEKFTRRFADVLAGFPLEPCGKSGEVWGARVAAYYAAVE